jgi:hypothetical protein
LSNEGALLVVVAFDDEDCVLKRSSRREEFKKKYLFLHAPAREQSLMKEMIGMGNAIDHRHTH